MCRALSLNEMSLAALGHACLRLAVHRAYGAICDKCLQAAAVQGGPSPPKARPACECAGAMSVEEDAAAGANATRGPRLSMEALSFLEANERELTMHPITLTFRSSGAALLALLHCAPSGCAGPLRKVACAVSLRIGVTLHGFRAADGSSALGLVRPCLPLLAILLKVCASLV